MKKRSKEYIIFMIMFILLWAYQFIRIGVINNDAVLARMSLYVKDIADFLSDRALNQARMSLAPYLKYIMYASASEWWFNSWNFIFILGAVIITGYFCSVLIGEVKFVWFYTLLSMLFMSITFEHTMPQVYGGFGYTYILFVLGILCYRKYMENRKWVYLILFLAGCMYAILSYEMFFALMPMYIIIVVKQQYSKGMSYFLKGMFLPVLVGGVGLGIRLAALINPSAGTNYVGNTFSLVSIEKIFRTGKQLVISAMPGYYLFNKKYQYLYSIYGDKTNSGIVIALCTAALGSLILGWCWMKNKKYPFRVGGGINRLWIFIMVGGIFMILPILPYSVSERYQECVSAEDMIAVPGSFFSYLAFSVILSYTLYYILQRVNDKFKISICAMVVICAIPIQIMNSAFANEHAGNYRRFAMTEELLKTNCIAQKTGKIIAKDLYETYDALAVRNDDMDVDYWTAYARSLGYDLELVDAEYDENRVCLYRLDDVTYFLSYLGDENEKILISKNYMVGEYEIEVNGRNIRVCFEEPVRDGDWYVNRAERE